MITPELVSYIKQQIQIGKSKEEITQALLAQNWHQNDIDQGLAQASSDAPLPNAGELPKAGQIFNEAWEIYKKHFKTLVILSLIPTAVVTILIALFVGGGIAGVVLKINTQALGAVGIVLGIIAFVFAIYLSLWGGVAQLYAIKDRAEAINWKEAFKRSKHKIGAFFTTSLLSTLAILGGFILLVIPGIIFALWFSQSSYVVVEENLQSAEALKRSKHYVQGRLGMVFGKVFYIVIITIGLFFLLGFILGFIQASAGMKEGSLSWMETVFSIIWTPLPLIYGYLLYNYLRAGRP